MGTSRLKIDKALAQLDTAGHASMHRCAHYVRLAIKAGGVKLHGYPAAAKDYGPTLKRAGFGQVPVQRYRPIKGDYRFPTVPRRKFGWSYRNV